jgi:hypothetical protein
MVLARARCIPSRGLVASVVLLSHRRGCPLVAWYRQPLAGRGPSDRGLRSVHEMVCKDVTAMERPGCPRACSGASYKPQTSDCSPPTLHPSSTPVAFADIYMYVAFLALFRDVDCEWRLNDLGFLLSSVFC